MPATYGTQALSSGASRSVTTRSLHATDADAPTMHNPTPVGETGKVPLSDGSKWVATSFTSLVPTTYYRLYVYALVAGDFDFIRDNDGYPITALEATE